jgi:hypothetical protein
MNTSRSCVLGDVIHYATECAKNQGVEGVITTGPGGEHPTINGKVFMPASMAAMGASLVADAGALLDRLLFVWPFADRLYARASPAALAAQAEAAAVSVRLEDICDELGSRVPGYSFVSDPHSRELFRGAAGLVLRRALGESALDESATVYGAVGERAPCPLGVTEQFAREYFRVLDKFLRALIVLVHVAGGQAYCRGTGILPGDRHIAGGQAVRVQHGQRRAQRLCAGRQGLYRNRLPQDNVGAALSQGDSALSAAGGWRDSRGVSGVCAAV